MHLKFGENIDTDESWCSMTNGCIQSHVTSTIISRVQDRDMVAI